MERFPPNLCFAFGRLWIDKRRWRAIVHTPFSRRRRKLPSGRRMNMKRCAVLLASAGLGAALATSEPAPAIGGGHGGGFGGRHMGWLRWRLAWRHGRLRPWRLGMAQSRLGLGWLGLGVSLWGLLLGNPYCGYAYPGYGYGYGYPNW
jgi:hypothetical protein